MCIAMQRDNRITTDSKWLTKRVHMTDKTVTTGLQELLAIRFVEPIRRNHRASKMAQNASLEVEEE
jgi:hypothetical protein